MVTADQNGELSRRHHGLLLAAVQEFIATAEPVGSNQLAARHHIGVRAAMVRNLMSDLEEAGFLTQPHTSAGRIPTDLAFRYYVDHLIPPPPIGFQDRAQIELHYSAPPADLNAMVRDTSRLLALMTGQAALVTAPRLESVMLERVQFVRLRDFEVMALFVPTTGGVLSRHVPAERNYQQDELDRMAGYLNDFLRGHSLESARVSIEHRLRDDRAAYDAFVHSALTLGGAAASGFSPAEVYVEGGSKAVEQPEFANRGRLRELLRALDDKTALLNLLERSLTQDGTMVSIGSENFDARLSAFAVVASAYASGRTPIGSLAIVGPVRMDYDRLIPLVAYTARALSRVFGH
jgi:heat-inducible transcriptional repressor